MGQNWRRTLVFAKRRRGNNIPSFGPLVDTFVMSVMLFRFLLDSIIGLDNPFQDIILIWARSDDAGRSVRFGVSREDRGGGKELRSLRGETQGRGGEGGGERDGGGDGGRNCGHGGVMDVWLFEFCTFGRTAGQSHIWSIVRLC
jgi:hypothetical protein